jgi:hypothetical protein
LLDVGTLEPSADSSLPADARSSGADATSSADATSDAPAQPPPDGGFLDVAGDGGTCNSLANPGQHVEQVDIGTARPAPTGGTMVDGAYVKTRDVIYTGPGGATGATGYFVREALTIVNSGTGQALAESTFTDNAGTTTERLTFSPTTGGGATTLTFVCPGYGPIPEDLPRASTRGGKQIRDRWREEDLRGRPLP